MSWLTAPLPTSLAAAPSVIPAASRLDCRIYVGSLHYNISDADIRALFSPFGAIKKVDMSLDAATGRSKGFCFVEFNDPACAIASLDMNAFEIAGRKIKVGRPSGASAIAAPTTGAAALLPAPVPSTAPPTISIIGFTPGSDKAQAQAQLSQALGLNADPTVGGAGVISSAPAPLRALVIRNIRNEINAAELHAVFLPFGSIEFCNFIGQETLVPSLTGLIAVRSALLEYNAASSAAECAVNMNGFSLGGLNLMVEAVDAAIATVFKGSLQTVTVHKAPSDQTGNSKAQRDKPISKNKCTTVILENLVSFQDSSDPTLKGEIAIEAEKQGKLRDIAIVVDQKKQVKIILTYFEPHAAEKSFNVMNGRFFGGKTVIATLGL